MGLSLAGLGAVTLVDGRLDLSGGGTPAGAVTNGDIHVGAGIGIDVYGPVIVTEPLSCPSNLSGVSGCGSATCRPRVDRVARRPRQPCARHGGASAPSGWMEQPERAVVADDGGEEAGELLLTCLTRSSDEMVDVDASVRRILGQGNQAPGPKGPRRPRWRRSQCLPAYRVRARPPSRPGSVSEPISGYRHSIVSLPGCQHSRLAAGVGRTRSLPTQRRRLCPALDEAPQVSRRVLLSWNDANHAVEDRPEGQGAVCAAGAGASAGVLLADRGGRGRLPS